MAQKRGCLEQADRQAPTTRHDSAASARLPARDADEDIEASADAAAKAYRAACLKTHPDHGGRSEDFQQVQRARDVLLTTNG